MTARPSRTLRAVAMSCAVLVGACSSVEPAPASSSAGPTEWPDATFCGQFTPPPFATLAPVAGISLRAIDKTHVEIRNRTGRRHYFTGFFWTIEDNLVCGRGVVSREGANGPLDPGSVLVIEGGSTPATPMTVSIWDAPGGESCDRPPIGEYLVPLSNVPPPVPAQT